jgi:hypothetical protein
MNDVSIGLEQTDDDILTYEVSDAALEAAGGPADGPPAASFNFTSYHLACC